MKTELQQKRLCGSTPKVGIRPTIDGRLGGVRESLEETTMQMARNVARLIETTLRHPDGSAVECVIADRCIGGVYEAALAADKFKKEGVGVSLTVTPCWCYGTETIDMDPLIPKAIWGFNGSERPGAVYLAAALAGHNQKGLPAFSIYGHDVQESGSQEIPADVRDKILRFVKAGLAVAIMRGTSYLSIGSVSMGIAGSVVDADFFQSYLDMRCEYVDMSELVRRMEKGIYDKDEFLKAREWTRKYCREGHDFNPAETQESRELKDKNWDTVVKMTLIIRDLMIGNSKLAEIGYGEEALGHNALVSGFQGQRQWTDYFPNGDFSEAILNSSFDWNGIRQPFMVATENDSLNGATMLFGHLLTNTAQIFADVRTYWSPEAIAKLLGRQPDGDMANGMLHLINSGSATLDGTGRQTRNGQPVMKPFYEVTEQEAEACLDATTWFPGMLEYFRGGGYSSGFLSKGGMPMTMARINLIKGIGPVLQIAEGYSIDIPQELHEKINLRTNPTWPTTWFVPRLTGKGAFADVYSVMANWGANHGSISYGHIGADLITLASMLRIPVCMHNVDEAQVFRPSAWSSFGMEAEGADYRACNVYGSVYG